MPGGYGNIPWGSSWGSNGSDDGSGEKESIPKTLQWDSFDLSTESDVQRILGFLEVSISGEAGSFFISSFNIASGGPYPTSTAALLIDTAVTESFTLQYQLRFNGLPEDFSEVAQGVATGRHIFLGAWSSQDFAAGFFISKQGWAYTGEVALDGNGDIVPAQPINVIAGSDEWTEEGKEYVIRIVVDAESQILYLYITPVEEAENGLQLKALLVAIPTASNVSDNAVISTKGTLSDVAWVEINGYQLSSKKLLPDLPPVADAGPDQAILRCSVLRLDASASFDPEGSPLTYEWRLTDAPLSSIFTVSGGDGFTLAEALPTGFTNEFYSDELAAVDALEPLQVNDVLTISAGSFTIKEIVRTPSFFIRVEYTQLPENKSGLQYKVIRQNGISGPSTISPTFYPDALGFYAFDLRVNDGASSSSPLGTDRSRVLINVLESPLPRGCSVDTNFLFDYLMSFWKLVEDRDRIATFWEALTRVAATELYTLWQVEYSKSLRDIQRVFVRRWLHYDGLLPEPSPELTSLRYLWGGVLSNEITGGVISAVDGTLLVVASPFLSDVVTVPLLATGDLTPESYAQQLQARLQELLGPSARATVWWTRAQVVSAPVVGSFPAAVTARTLSVSINGGPDETATITAPVRLEDFVAELAAQLPSASVTLTASQEIRVGAKNVGGPGAVSTVNIDPASTLLVANGGPLDFSLLAGDSSARIHITANIPFTLTSLSTAPAFTYPRVNTVIGAASGGERVGERTFRASLSLAGLPLREDDLLVVDRSTYRIVRVVDDPSDTFSFQRLVVKDALPETPPGGVEWAIPGWVESTFLDFWNGLVDRGDHVDFEVTVPVGEQFVTALVSATALGANETLSGRLALNTAELAAQLSLDPAATVRLARVQRRRFIPIDSRVVDVPILSDVIEVVDDDTVLRRNVDFFIETFRGRSALRFSVGVGSDLGDVWEGGRPPPRLWAEYTYVDNEDLIEANFGAAIKLTRDRVPDTVDYLSAVRGIWYALYNGPTLANLRIAIQIFLGLPFAEEAGVIEEIRTDFFTRRGRILIRDSNNSEIVRSYTYPRVLGVDTNPATGEPYKVGDTVNQFAPLVTGAEIIDWVKNPRWFQGILTQGIFYEVQKYHSFLVRVDADAFNLTALGFAQEFVKDIKPIYTDPLYVVLFRVAGDGDEIDVIDSITYNLKLFLQDSVCAGRQGASTTYDQPWPSGWQYGETWRNAFDTDDNPATALPSYPGPSDAVRWGWDKEYLCPGDTVEATQCRTFVNALPRYDTIFKHDYGPISQLVDTAPGPLVFPQTFNLGAATEGTITRVFLQLNGPTGPITQGDWVVEVLVDSVIEETIPFSIGREEYQLPGPSLVLVVTSTQNVEIARAVNVPVLDGQTVELRVRAADSSAQSPTWTSFSYAVNIQLLPWKYDILVNGELCGGMNIPQLVTARTPGSPPVPVITSHSSSDNIIAGEVVVIEGTVTDPDGADDVMRVDVSITNGAVTFYAQAVLSPSGDPRTWSAAFFIPESWLGPGSIQVKAWDLSELEGAPPAIPITFVSGLALFLDTDASVVPQNEVFQWLGTVESSIPVTSVEAFLGPTSLGLAVLDPPVDDVSSWSFAYAPSALGATTIRFVATDENNNVVEVEDTFWVNAPPYTEIIDYTPEMFLGVTYEVEVQYDDPDGYVTLIEVLVNGQVLGSVNPMDVEGSPLGSVIVSGVITAAMVAAGDVVVQPRATDDDGLVVLGAPVNATVWSPAILPNTDVWVSADDSGLSIGAGIANKGDVAGSFAVSGSGNAPTIEAGVISGRSAIRFTNGNQYLQGPIIGASGNPAHTIAVVAKARALINNFLQYCCMGDLSGGTPPQTSGIGIYNTFERWYGGRNLGTGNLHIAVNSITDLVSPHVYIKTHNGSNGAAWYDGDAEVLDGTVTSYNMSAAGRYALGTANLTGVVSADVGEVLMVRRSVTMAERLLIQGYLAHRWTPVVPTFASVYYPGVPATITCKVAANVKSVALWVAGVLIGSLAFDGNGNASINWLPTEAQANAAQAIELRYVLQGNIQRTFATTVKVFSLSLVTEEVSFHNFMEQGFEDQSPNNWDFTTPGVVDTRPVIDGDGLFFDGSNDYGIVGTTASHKQIHARGAIIALFTLFSGSAPGKEDIISSSRGAPQRPGVDVWRDKASAAFAMAVGNGQATYPHNATNVNAGVGTAPYNKLILLTATVGTGFVTLRSNAVQIASVAMNQGSVSTADQFAAYHVGTLANIVAVQHTRMRLRALLFLASPAQDGHLHPQLADIEQYMLFYFAPIYDLVVPSIAYVDQDDVTVTASVRSNVVSVELWVAGAKVADAVIAGGTATAVFIPTTAQRNPAQSVWMQATLADGRVVRSEQSSMEIFDELSLSPLAVWDPDGISDASVDEAVASLPQVAGGSWPAAAWVAGGTSTGAPTLRKGGVRKFMQFAAPGGTTGKHLQVATGNLIAQPFTMVVVTRKRTSDAGNGTLVDGLSPGNSGRLYFANPTLRAFSGVAVNGPVYSTMHETWGVATGVFNSPAGETNSQVGIGKTRTTAANVGTNTINGLVFGGWGNRDGSSFLDGDEALILTANRVLTTVELDKFVDYANAVLIPQLEPITKPVVPSVIQVDVSVTVTGTRRLTKATGIELLVDGVKVADGVLNGSTVSATFTPGSPLVGAGRVFRWRFTYRGQVYTTESTTVEVFDLATVPSIYGAFEADNPGVVVSGSPARVTAIPGLYGTGRNPTPDGNVLPRFEVGGWGGIKPVFDTATDNLPNAGGPQIIWDQMAAIVAADAPRGCTIIRGMIFASLLTNPSHAFVSSTSTTPLVDFRMESTNASFFRNASNNLKSLSMPATTAGVRYIDVIKFTTGATLNAWRNGAAIHANADISHSVGGTGYALIDRFRIFGDGRNAGRQLGRVAFYWIFNAELDGTPTTGTIGKLYQLALNRWPIT